MTLKNPMSLKIILAAGGTGGHVFPAIATGEELKNHNYEPVLLTDERGYKYLQPEIIKAYVIKIRIPKTGLIHKLLFLANMVTATIKTLKLFYQIKPSLTIGFGGYPTLPILFTSFLCRVPIVIHEPNSILGNVNQLFMPLAAKITFAYPNFISKYKRYESKIIITNNIIRKDIQLLPVYRKKDDNVFTILIVGGSQGAKTFADIVPKAIRQILFNQNLGGYIFKIIHQVPKAETLQVKTIYEQLDLDYEIAEFFFQMSEQYAKADLLIARAGASTLSEITHLKLPAILIPYPYAMLNHQYFNALAFQENGYGKCIEQKNLTVESLAAEILAAFEKHSKTATTSIDDKSGQTAGGLVMLDTVNKILLRD